MNTLRAIMRLSHAVSKLALLGLVCALVGCGSDVEGTADPTGSGASGSGGSGPSSGSGGSTSGSGGSLECPELADEGGEATVTIRFRNDSFTAIYLPGLCDGVAFDVTPTSGPDGLTYHFEGGCLQTCADLQTSPPFVCDACAPSAYRLEPGGSIEATWTGTGLKDTGMAPECWAEVPSNEDLSCRQIVAAPAGEYRVEVLGFADCDGECTCNDDGSCFGTAAGQSAYHDPASFQFPGTTSLDVVFGPCAFPCPG